MGTITCVIYIGTPATVSSSIIVAAASILRSAAVAAAAAVAIATTTRYTRYLLAPCPSGTCLLAGWLSRKDFNIYMTKLLQSSAALDTVRQNSIACLGMLSAILLIACRPLCALFRACFWAYRCVLCACCWACIVDVFGPIVPLLLVPLCTFCVNNLFT